jgi:alpha-N-arabinofuranosidase
MERAYIDIHTAPADGPQISRFLHSAALCDHTGSAHAVWAGEGQAGATADGLRSDIVDLLTSAGLPALRWPGTGTSAVYRWTDGVGPRDERPTRFSPAAGASDDHAFGTAEFMTLCERVGAAPWLLANVTTSSITDVHDWLSYCCRCDQDQMARQRLAHGRHQPWPVAVFELGAGLWAAPGAYTPADYAASLRRLAAHLRATAGETAPAILACGHGLAAPDWSDDLLAALRQPPDARHSIDGVSANLTVGRRAVADDCSPKGYARVLRELAVFEDALDRFSGLLAASAAHGKPLDGTLGSWGLSGRGTGWGNSLRDALFTALAMHALHAHCDSITAAALPLVADDRLARFTRRDGVLLTTPAGHAAAMLAGHQDGNRLTTVVSTPAIDVSDSPTRPALSVNASSNADGVFLSVVNASVNEQYKTDITISGGRKLRCREAVRMSARALADGNTPAEPKHVEPVTMSAMIDNNRFRMALPPRSITTVAMTADDQQ